MSYLSKEDFYRLCSSSIFLPMLILQPWYSTIMERSLFHLILNNDLKNHKLFLKGILIPRAYQNNYYFIIDLKKLLFFNFQDKIFKISFLTSFNRLHSIYLSSVFESSAYLNDTIALLMNCNDSCLCSLYINEPKINACTCSTHVFSN